jgi:hypothetical protein
MDGGESRSAEKGWEHSSRWIGKENSLHGQWESETNTESMCTFKVEAEAQDLYERQVSTKKTSH